MGAENRFCATCGAPLAGAGEAPGPVAPPGAQAATDAPQEDELRPVTALFADIVGSTALGERLAPEEVKALVGECVSQMSRAVEEFGGTVQAYMGDGIAAYFGVPQAHEDDPERAARAALRVIEVVGVYAQDVQAAWGVEDFSVRVGVNSGQTGVGVVGGAAEQTVALGDTTNVAARLQTVADPGTIAVGEVAARRLDQRFVLEPMGDRAVKGREGEVKAWRLVEPRAGDTVPPPGPLVGRDAEVEQLGKAIDDLEAGRGQVLLIVGEAGIGRTRLLGELKRIATDRATWLECECRSYGGQRPYQPFIELLRRWADIAPGDAEVAARTRLRARLDPLFGTEVDQVFPYLARLLSVQLDAGAEEELAGLRPEDFADRLHGAFAAWIEQLAQRDPVVIALDDVHWADASTRELAEDLLELTDRLPLLIAASLRREPTSQGWGLRLKVLSDYPHRGQELALGPLSEDEAARLLELCLEDATLADADRASMTARAEGNPLYLEELARAAKDDVVTDTGRTWALSGSAMLMPSALEGVLVARIDGLTQDARHLAQTAAVIGRVFPEPVLERVYEGDLQNGLAILLRAEVIREHQRFPEPQYAFHHGMLQESALATLTPDRQRELSGRVAAALEQLHADELDEHLEQLAYYYYRSDNNAKALEYLQLAAERAAAVDADTQAAQLWRRALRLAGRMGDEEAERRVRERLGAAVGEEPD